MLVKFYDTGNNLTDKHYRGSLARIMVFLLGICIFLHISDAYVMEHHKAEEEPKSITMFINGQDNSENRRNATAISHRRRNSEDILENLFNNAPESGKIRQHEMPTKRRTPQTRSSESGLSKLFDGVINYFTKSPVLYNARSNSGGGETKIDLVKLVNGAFTYLASLNPKYRANMRTKHLEPRPIEFRSKDDTSLLYEINTKKIVEDVTNLLSSETVKSYVDTAARKAAMIYRAVTNDL